MQQRKIIPIKLFDVTEESSQINFDIRQEYNLINNDDIGNVPEVITLSQTGFSDLSQSDMNRIISFLSYSKNNQDNDALNIAAINQASLDLHEFVSKSPDGELEKQANDLEPSCIRQSIASYPLGCYFLSLGSCLVGSVSCGLYWGFNILLPKTASDACMLGSCLTALISYPFAATSCCLAHNDYYVEKSINEQSEIRTLLQFPRDKRAQAFRGLLARQILSKHGDLNTHQLSELTQVSSHSLRLFFTSKKMLKKDEKKTVSKIAHSLELDEQTVINLWKRSRL